MSKSNHDLNPSPMFQLRKALEDERDVELPMDPAYYDRLHARIMSAVDERAPTGKPSTAAAAPTKPAMTASPSQPSAKTASSKTCSPKFTDVRTSQQVAMARTRSAE